MFFTAELEHEIGREPVGVTGHRFIQIFCGNPVKLRKMAVEHDPLAANKKDAALDRLDGKD